MSWKKYRLTRAYVNHVENDARDRPKLFFNIYIITTRSTVCTERVNSRPRRATVLNDKFVGVRGEEKKKRLRRVHHRTTDLRRTNDPEKTKPSPESRASFSSYFCVFFFFLFLPRLITFTRIRVLHNLVFVPKCFYIPRHRSSVYANKVFLSVSFFFFLLINPSEKINGRVRIGWRYGEGVIYVCTTLRIRVSSVYLCGCDANPLRF